MLYYGVKQIMVVLMNVKIIGVQAERCYLACGGTKIEISKINLECVLCEKEKKRTAPLPATAVFYDTLADILPHIVWPRALAILWYRPLA